MIDVENEKLVSFAEATKILPGRPNITTVWRWRNRGVKGVKLETILSGGRRFTSVEAIRRFQSAVTAAADGTPTGSQIPRHRESAIDRAERESARLGV